MIDCHHDLLSILYYCYCHDDYQYLEEWIQNFRDDNVSGLLANLYFMNPADMKEKFGLEEIDVTEMFRISTQLFHQYLPDYPVVFSIEGCDYIKDTHELEELYQLGLRNILLVWNNPNQYGSGNLGDYGLTEKGKEFLRKAIDLGISIDLSHMNEKTFFDTIELILEEKENGKNVKVLASHSNCREICNHERNLSDEEIQALKSVNGLLGIVGYDQFVRDVNCPDYSLKQMYLDHITHAVDIMGIDSVGVSSDDMDFYEKLFHEEYGEMVFSYSSIQKEIGELLRSIYSEEDVKKILYQNVYNYLFKEEIK